MADRQLLSRSRSLAREVDSLRQETERDRASVEVDEELNNVTDRRLERHDELRNDVISASQFGQFMSEVMKQFEELKDRNSKLAESIKSVKDEMSIKIEVVNKDLSESLTRQFREDSESIKKEITNKLKTDMHQLCKYTDLEVNNLRENVSTAHEKLNDKMDENMSVVQRQIETVSQKANQEIEVLRTRLDAKQASEDLSGASSSKRNAELDVNRNSHNTLTLSGGVSETSGSHN
jgi:hypothetical protein